MIQEQELLPDQHAVLAMDARDLRQQALELCREDAHPCRRGLRGQLQKHVQGDLIGRDAQNLSGIREQRVALALDLRALHHLLLDLGEAGEHALDVLHLDRLALGEHDLEHAPVRGQLALEMLDETGQGVPPAALPEAGGVPVAGDVVVAPEPLGVVRPVDCASMR